VTRQDLAAAQLTASQQVGTGLRLCRTAFAKVDSDRQGELRSSGRVSSATGTPRHLSSGGSGWLVPVDGTSGPGLRFKALANRSDACVRCQRLASRASRSSSSQCQGPSRMRRRIRTGPWTAQTAVRFTGSSCSSTCVVLAMVESSPQRSTLRQGLCCCLGQASMAVRRLFGRRCCGPAGGSRPGGWTERWVTDRVAGSRIRPMMAGPPTWPLGAGGAGSKGSHVGCQPDRGVGGSSRSRPPERWSSACWRACRVV
jgi:hypothetical protein